MSTSKLEQVLALWKIARHDPRAQEIGRRYDELEVKFAETVTSLPREDQNILWDFVMTSDELNHRVLEMVCEVFRLDPVKYLRKLEE